jgi:hypothetical protein
VAFPQTGFLYDQFPFFLIPKSTPEMAFAVICSLRPFVIAFDRANIVTLSRAYIPLLIVGLYLPALVMVLRRPNEGRSSS